MAFKRWLYRDGRPNILAKILNRGWAILHSLGIYPNYYVTLEVAGRQSGKTISFPLVMAVMDGERYLVSMLGEDTNWVRNVRAAGGKARLRHGISELVLLVEVDVGRRAPILKEYLQHAPGARPHIPVSKDAPISEFEKIASQYPVFRLVTVMIRKLWQTTSDFMREGKLAEAIQYLEDGLAHCEGQMFKSLIGADFTNDPAVIAGSINDLITFCDRSFDVRAVYLEMNGFDINPDQWFFDSFAYRHYVEDADELDWLCEWDSPDWPDVTLTGLERVQADFKRYGMGDGEPERSVCEPAEYAVLLVMCKFGRLIERSISEGLIRQIPILATAHDFDIIPRFNNS